MKFRPSESQVRRLCGLLRFALAGISLPACGGNSDGPKAVSLAPTELARVGGRALSKQHLRAVGTVDRGRFDLVLGDHLLAQSAAEGSPGLYAALERAVLARALIGDLSDAALARGELSEAELTRAREALWIELDRPRAVRAVLARSVVKPLEPEEAAFAVMQRLAEKVRGARSPQAFGQAVQSLGAETEVSVTPLPPVAADGRVVPLSPSDPRETELPRETVAAISALREATDQSAVFAEPGGFALVFALEVVEEKRLGPEEAREWLVPRALSERYAPELQRVHEAALQSTQVQIHPHHGTLTRLVWREQ